MSELTLKERDIARRICYVCGEPITSGGAIRTDSGLAHIGYNDIRFEDIPEGESWLYHMLKPCGTPIPAQYRRAVADD